MFTTDIVTLSVGYPQAWMAQKELDEHPSKYPKGATVRQDKFGTGEWYIVRNKTDKDYQND